MISFNGVPVVGFGTNEASPPTSTSKASPWTIALATSVVSAATGWAIEEVARRTIRRKHR